MIDKKTLGNKIKLLREENKLSQTDFALRVGLARGTISQIEQGNRNIDFLELATIAKEFKLKTDYFLIDERLPDLKLSNIKFKADKLKNLILYILESCAGKPNVGETVLYKLLYFSDFNNYEINNKSISGLNYINLQYGPVPVASQYLPVVKDMEARRELKIISQDYFGLKLKRYINLISYDINSLSPKEMKVIDNVISSLSNMSALQIEEYSHGDAPWLLSEEHQTIPYKLVFQRQTPYSQKDVNDLRLYEVAGAKDILSQLGPISKKEYDYYENL